MAVNNSLANTKQAHPGQPAKTGITTFLNSMAVAANIDQALGKDNRQRFITGVISAVNNNAALQECTNKSILSGALLGESLKLSPSPQLGHYYLVPFNDKEQGKHQEQMRLYDWMDQAKRDAAATDKFLLPAVFHKKNNHNILVTMELEDWMQIYREYESGMSLDYSDKDAAQDGHEEVMQSAT